MNATPDGTPTTPAFSLSSDSLATQLAELEHGAALRTVFTAMEDVPASEPDGDRIAYLSSLVVPAPAETASRPAVIVSLHARRRSALVALAASAVVLASGTAAAAAGALPETVQREASRIAQVIGVTLPDGSPQSTGNEPTPSIANGRERQVVANASATSDPASVASPTIVPQAPVEAMSTVTTEVPSTRTPVSEPSTPVANPPSVVTTAPATPSTTSTPTTAWPHDDDHEDEDHEDDGDDSVDD